MKIFYTIVFVALGLLFGSFYNVVGLRLLKKESLLMPRSHCLSCNHILKWYELIPVASYIFLKGRCKNCHSKISFMYPVVEVLTAILFGISFYKYGFSTEFFLSLLLSSVLMIVVVTDLTDYIIPDVIVVITGVLIFIYNIVTKGFIEACTYVLYGMIIFLLMYLLMIFGNTVFKEESLGGGDIKLMGVLGMINKPIISVVGLALAALIALPSSLFFMINKKDKIIPFGPFLIIAIILIMFLKIDTADIIDFVMKR